MRRNTIAILLLAACMAAAAADAPPPPDPLRTAAETGNTDAMLRLALEYYRGEARPRKQ